MGPGGWLKRMVAAVATAGALVAFLALVGSYYVPLYVPRPDISADSQAVYKKMADAISDAAVKADLRELCATRSRAIGTPGYERALEHIRTRFERAGLRDVMVLRLPVAVPVTKRAELHVLKNDASAAEDPQPVEKIDIYPLWPNLVRTCTVPPQGLTGHLVDAGDGLLKRFNGAEVQSAIVLLDADCDSRWLNVPLLGGSAVIFCGSEKLTREQAEQKSVTTPVNVPRFFVHEQDGRRLRGLARAGEEAAVRIFCKVDIEERSAGIVCGILDGAGREVSRETLMLEAYFDSISQVPDLSEGAEAACGIAGLLQAVSNLAAHRPQRSVLFVANGAHFQGQGIPRFVGILGRRVPDEDTAIQTARQIGRYEKMLAEERARLERCERELELLRAGGSGDRGPERWISEADEDLRTQIVRDIQMAAKAVLDEAFERKIRGTGDWGVPRERRLRLQKICWESSLEVLSTVYWDEVSAALSWLRGKARRRLEALTAKAEGLGNEIDFLRSIKDLNLRLYLGLDLSSGTGSFGLFERGNISSPPYETRGPVKPLCDRIVVMAEGIQKVLDGRPLDAEGGPGTADASLQSREVALPRFLGGFKPTKQADPYSCLVAMMRFDLEWCYVANRTAATLCTLVDPRPYVDTPYDTLDRVNVPNLTRQLRLMVPMIKALLDDPEPLAGETDLYDHTGTATLHAMSVPRGGAIVPDHPVEGAVIVDKATDQLIQHWYTNIKAYACGVRENQLAIAGEDGAAVFPTGWHEVWTPPGRPFEAYKFDPETGEITHALDRGVSGAEKFPNEILLDRRHKEGTLVLFRCQPMALFDLLDPRYMSLLRRLEVIGADQDSTPLRYGYNLSTQPTAGHETETSGESCAIVYVEPGEKFKVTMSAGMMGLRLALLNMPSAAAVAGPGAAEYTSQPRPLERMENVSGEGYAPAASARLPLTPLLVARDLWRLDDFRIRNLASRGIRSELLETYHDQAGRQLARAEEALAQRHYSAGVAAAREAWAYESRAYPLVRSAADDAIKGVIFYLFLLLPFSFFGERLLFGFPNIVHRIVATAGIFIVVFIILWLSHPAFKLTTSPVMVLLAFITLALSLLVILLLGGKVAQQLRQLRQREEARSIDVSRLSSLRTAFLLGISNLRKRPVRSGLTAATLILLSFTVVSFTSVRQVPRFNKIDTGKDALYDGILMKRPQWATLNAAVYHSLQALYGDRFAVVPRAWYSGGVQVSIPGRPAPLVKRVDDGEDQEQDDAREQPAEPEYAWPLVNSLLGLHSREAEVTHIDELISAGRWFSGNEADECILPTEVADILELTSEDAGNVSVRIHGRLLRVVGIMDGDRLLKFMDLNDEPITPIDTTIAQTTLKSKEETMADRYYHFLPKDTVILPYGVLKEFGWSRAGQSSLVSVAVAMDPKTAEAAVQESVIRRYMASKAVNLYVGIDGRSYFYNVPSMMSFSGLKNVAMPLAIAFLIVLNTMLGAVYERHGDIYIFTAIGLAPSHIGTLFLAESCVFATIGGVAGYLIGQVFSVVSTKLGWLSGLTLNYSSGSVVTAMVVVMGVVLLSTLYPAYKASRLASPSVERKWTLPESTGDRMVIDLPFLVEERYAAGLLSFIGHYFRAHREAGVGKFISENVSLARAAGGLSAADAPANLVAAHVWLAPYDLGVSQDIRLATRPPTERICGLQLELLRTSGEPRSWRRANFIFLDGLRKQFLRWRTVPESERRRYVEETEVVASSDRHGSAV